MKKHLLAAIALLSFFCANSQVQFGIKGGINLASVRYINTENSKARVGWNAGGVLKIPIDNHLFIQPELQYSSKGFGYSATATTFKGSMRLNYIALPILVGYTMSPNFDFLAGPEFGFLSKALSK